MTVDDVIVLLHLRPHPEGGYYAETWRDTTERTERGTGSAILFLLPGGVTSAWHRIDAAEIWHHYAGAAVELSFALDGAAATTHRLGDGLDRGERPQLVVPAGAWQRARSTGEWSLVGCTVSPAFTFHAFELAPLGWSPEPAAPEEPPGSR